MGVYLDLYPVLSYYLWYAHGRIGDFRIIRPNMIEIILFDENIEFLKDLVHGILVDAGRGIFKDEQEHWHFTEKTNKFNPNWTFLNQKDYLGKTFYWFDLDSEDDDYWELFFTTEKDLDLI